MNPTTETTFEPCWAIVEIFGHQRYAGLVGEQPIAGDKMLRLDIPAVPEERAKRTAGYHPEGGGYAKPGHAWEYEMVLDAVPAETKFFGVKAIYALTPCSEDRARAEAARIATRGKRVENISEVCMAPLITGDVALNAWQVAYSCDTPNCGSEQTFTGENKDDCNTQARKAGWSLPDGSQDGGPQCPDCMKEPW